MCGASAVGTKKLSLGSYVSEANAVGNKKTEASMFCYHALYVQGAGHA